MNIKSLAWLYIFLTFSLTVFISVNLWLLSIRVPNHLNDLAVFFGTIFIIGGFFWMIYTVILSLKVLPKIDKLVYPDRVDFFRISDNQLFKMLRLNEYAAAIHSKRARRLNPLKVDLRTLPGQLRVPITVYLYWMILNFGAMITGFLIFSYTGRL